MRAPALRGARLRRALAALLLVAAGVGVWLVVVGEGPDVANPFASGPEQVREDYCELVEERREQVAEAGGGQSAGALLDLLPTLRDLAEASPRDIAADWDLVVDRVGALGDALAEAGVDPDAYDPQEQPEGLTDEEQRRIAASAKALVDPDTLRSVGRLEQQALDICAVQLGL